MLKFESQYDTLHFKCVAFSHLIRKKCFVYLFHKCCVSHCTTKLFILASPQCETFLRMTNSAPQLCSQTTTTGQTMLSLLHCRQTDSFFFLSLLLCLLLSSVLHLSYEHVLFFLISSVTLPLYFFSPSSSVCFSSSDLLCHSCLHPSFFFSFLFTNLLSLLSLFL